ncbi:DegT/DnrJ/EryC1/StrS family aminotransferase [Geodermatophilus sp. SYSU D00703]
MLVKSSVEGLAVFGGPPAFRSVRHVGAPNIGDRDRLHQLIDDALDRRWLTNDGPYVQAFERRLAEVLSVRNCVATSNATSALMLVAAALELGGEVIMPSLTFVATAHALTWQGITPVFCDVDPVTWTLDPRRVEELITPETTAVVGVHLWGTPCDVAGLQDVASRYGLRLVYDAAQALGTSYAGRPLGSFGDAEVFSFHATKVCNSFEGGAIATEDDDLAALLSLTRNFGFVDVDRVVTVGINAKMSEVHAAMGITSLESLDGFVAANRRNHFRYREGLQALPGITMHDPPLPDRSSAHQYVVVEVDEESGLSRDELLEVLTAENVRARRYFYPGCHGMEPYRTRSPDAGRDLPVTEAILRRVLVLPTGTATTVEDIEQICELLAFATARAGEIRARLRGREQGAAR